MDTKGENKASEEIAKEIVSTAAEVDEAVDVYNVKNQQDDL